MFPDTIRDIITHIYADGDWQDISSDVQFDSGRGCTVERGRRDEAPRCGPQKLRMVLDDTSGDYTPTNPMGAYWPSFGLNTPVRQYFREIRDRFTRTVSNSPGTAETGQTWTTAGSGGSVLAADYQVTGSALTMRLPTSGLYRRVGIDDADLYLSTVETRADFTLPFSDVTGGIVSLGLHLRVGTTTGYQVYADIATNETVTVRIASPSGDLDSEVVTGLTFTGQALTLVASAEGQTVRGKVFATSGAEPYGWHLEVHDTGDLIGPGGMIVEVAAASGNTNARPFLTTVDNVEVLVPRIHAEISSPPRGRDESGTWKYVSVTASGILQRLSQGKDPLQSSLRRAYLADDVARPVAYWPCEDGDDATQIASAIPGHPPMMVTGAPNFASNDDFDSSSPLPAINQSGWTGLVPEYDNPDAQAQMRFLLTIPAAGDSAATGTKIFSCRTTGSARYWDIVYTTAGSGSFTINIFDESVVLLHTTGAVDFSLHGRPVRVSLELDQVGGNIDWALSTLGVDAVGGGISGTLAGRDFGLIAQVSVGWEEKLFTTTAVGHVTVQNAITSLFELLAELQARVGETALRRAKRLCAEESIPFNYRGTLSESVEMGPQRPKAVLDLLNECVEADRGSMSEARGTFGLVFRSRTSAYNQTAVVAADHEQRHLAYPLIPNPDDLLPRNRVTVKRDSGSEATAVLESGRMSILAPQDGGIGAYGTSETLNVETDAQLPDLAGWLLALGTVVDERYPEINIDLGRSAIADDPVLRWSVLDLDIDDLITIDNTSELRAYDGIRQLARGYTERYAQDRHTITVNGTPAAPYDVFEVESAGDEGRLDTTGAVLAVAVDSDDTALSVATTSDPLWITTASNPSDLPMDWFIGGERVTVTDLDNEVIAAPLVGVASHGDNASLAPALPVGWQEGNLLIGIGAIRNTSAFMSGATGGYDWMINAESNVRLFWKIAGSSESAPTVSFSGGSAGDTTSAVMLAVPGKFNSLSTGVVLHRWAGALNASAQNVAYPGLPVGAADCLILYVAWKQDDYTSATSPGTELIEASTTTGNDQSLTISYQIQTTATNITPGSFTITGGASAVSRGIVAAVRCDRQAATVTRSVNEVVKSHAAAAPVTLPPLNQAL